MTMHVTLLVRPNDQLVASSDKWTLFGKDYGRLMLKVDGDDISITCLDADDAEAIAGFINERARAKELARFRGQLVASLEAAE